MAGQANRPPRRPNARPTIGLLEYDLLNTQPVWLGAADEAEKRDANLICFAGETWRPPGEVDKGADTICSLMNGEILDGLVTWAGEGVANTQRFSQQEVEDFFSRYAPLPMVNYEGVISGIPSIVTDTRPGMRELLVHLIETHGCRRIILIRGPKDHFETEERLQVYKETLAEYDLPLDQNRISPPRGWGVDQGMEAMNLLLDERKLRPKVDFDAVVGTESEFALGALRVLQARGVLVPDDIAIAGFNDSPGDRAATPPLTTVRKPFYEAGRLAIAHLFDLFAGQEIPETVDVPTELKVRRSCGCLTLAVEHTPLELPTEPGESLDDVLAARGEAITAAIEQTVAHSTLSLTPGWAKQLLHTFAADLKAESPGVFLPTLDRVLRQVVAGGGDLSQWYAPLSLLRRHTQSGIVGNRDALSRANDLWEQAQVMIGETARRNQMRRGLQAEQKHAAFHQLSAALAVATTIAELMDALVEGLPQLGFPSFYLALYEPDYEPIQKPSPLSRYLRLAPEWAQLLLAYTGDRRIELDSGERRFRSPQLVPDGLLPENRRYTLIAQALYSRDNPLGFLLLEMGPRMDWVYHALRVQISSALQGALLTQQVRHHAKSLEAAVTETVTTAEEMQQTVNQTELRVQSVADAAQQSVEVSRAGQNAVSDAVAGMETLRQQVEAIAENALALAEHTKQIGAIISAVQDIADQSKLLALNARIEAARAGERGRTFAVVANEMKNLATRSREATAQVRTILQEIQQAANTAVTITAQGTQGAQQGVVLVNRAGNAIRDLAATIEEAAQAATEIAVTTRQQTNGMKQLVASMRSIRDGSR